MGTRCIISWCRMMFSWLSHPVRDANQWKQESVLCVTSEQPSRIADQTV